MSDEVPVPPMIRCTSDASGHLAECMMHVLLALQDISETWKKPWQPAAADPEQRASLKLKLLPISSPSVTEPQGLLTRGHTHSTPLYPISLQGEWLHYSRQAGSLSLYLHS